MVFCCNGLRKNVEYVIGNSTVMILIATCNVEMKTSEQDIKQQFSQKYLVINLYILE